MLREVVLKKDLSGCEGDGGDDPERGRAENRQQQEPQLEDHHGTPATSWHRSWDKGEAHPNAWLYSSR
jgi:hypothetical protein